MKSTSAAISVTNHAKQIGAVQKTIKKKLKKAYQQIAPIKTREISHSMSPYSEDFEKCLDPKMRRLVMALVEKNYLPLSSCEGHSIYEGRDVVLAFPNYMEALLFSTAIRASKVPVRFTNYDDPAEFMNASLELDDEGNVLNLVQKKGKTEDAVLSLNQMFYKKYDKYHLLHMHLAEDGGGIKSTLYKKLLLDRNTRKLAKFIEKKHFPQALI